MSSHDYAQLDQKLNDAILAGKALEAFEQYYAEGVAMQENSNAPTVGKDVNRKREEDFFGSVAEFHGAAVLSSAAAGDVTFSEWMMDVTFKDGTRKKLEQVAVRRWRDGKVVHERFYYDTAG